MISLELPEALSDRVVWIEDRLMSDDFDDWFDQQVAVVSNHDQASFSSQRHDVALTSEQLDRVAAAGLGAWGSNEIESMLRQPANWKAVRDHVLVHGSDHWTHVAQRRTDDAKIIDRVAHEIANAKSPTSGTVHPSSGSAWVERGFVAAIAAVATAAMLLVMLQSGDQRNEEEVPGIGPVAQNTTDPKQPAEPPVAPSAVTGWGFEKFANQVRQSNEQLGPPLDRASYLEQLALAAESWTAKRPEDSMGVAKRIGEFRMGCSAILIAKHEPLPSSDRAWLKEKCQRWATALEKHLADLELGDDPGTVRGQVDSTVIKIAAALRGRLESAPI